MYILPRIPVQTKLLPRAERRASILHGAAEAFARSGFARTSMEDVAAACGVSRLILYRHFETKEELYRAVLGAVFDRMGEELEAALAQESRRGIGVRILLTVAREEPAAFTLLWRHAAREPEFAEYAHELRSISVAVLRQFLGLERGDALMDAWMGDALFSWLIESTLSWLEIGDVRLDDQFSAHVSEGLARLRSAWT